MKKFSAYLLIVLFPFLLQCSSGGKEEPIEPIVKNIIVMIGDGMGVSQIYAGLTANNGSLSIERSQYVGFIKTHAADNYITDFIKRLEKW